MTATIDYDDKRCLLKLEGKWTISHIQQTFNALPSPFKPNKALKIDGRHIQTLDSSGALAIGKFLLSLTQSDVTFECHFHPKHQALIDYIDHKLPQVLKPLAPIHYPSFLYRLGYGATEKAKLADSFLILLGDLWLRFIAACLQRKRFQFKTIAVELDRCAIKALPILALLSFLIGIVLAYQMGVQLKNYGADIFIVYLTGMAIMREFSPLITAIIVAGRTSSSFTAQIGSMKVHEEIDAIRTMGVSPVELLVMPKVIALLFSFPLLIFWSDIFGTLGAMVMSNAMLDIHFLDFLQRLKESLGVQQYILGLVKAPTFALIIALVGCHQGFLVDRNSDSVGAHTTKAVVQAIFLIIICDAIYSIVYTFLDL